jgi:hypothetical protein
MLWNRILLEMPVVSSANGSISCFSYTPRVCYHVGPVIYIPVKIWFEVFWIVKAGSNVGGYHCFGGKLVSNYMTIQSATDAVVAN